MPGIQPSEYSFFTSNEIKPAGWLRRQLEIEANGLAGNLDKVWPDVRDSAWIGGTREGWERVPYWLDGFIPLAFLLENGDMQARAKKYIDAILARQQPDGWICPCKEEERAGYDTWAVLLITKVLMLYFDCSGDGRAADAALNALKNLSVHIKEHPLFNWGRHRWYEGLIAIRRLYELNGGDWLIDLAKELHRQGFDYEALISGPDWEPFRKPQHEWLWNAHVVNYAMALKANLLYSRFDPETNAGFSRAMLETLRRYHGMPTGHFTGDEILSGTSPVQGTELCGVVEAMYSAEINYAVSGDPFWMDYCEKLAFNALPAACTPDMWAHQYDQQTNQIGALRENTRIWSSNSTEAGRYGLEPNFGCCTANFGQGWPKFALSAFLRSANGVLSAIPVPSRLKLGIKGVDVEIELAARYPFGSRLVYTVKTAAPVEFELGIRIPGTAAGATVDGTQAKPGSIVKLTRRWSGVSVITAELKFEVRLTERPSGLFFAERGPLVYSLPIPYAMTREEYEADGVERKFPYCDYETLPEGPWNYGFADGCFTFEEREIGDFPFSQEMPPAVLKTVMKKVPWSIREGCRAVCRERPDTGEADGAAPETKELIPYGCTMLRMTEMPKLN